MIKMMLIMKKVYHSSWIISDIKLFSGLWTSFPAFTETGAEKSFIKWTLFSKTFYMGGLSDRIRMTNTKTGTKKLANTLTKTRPNQEFCRKLGELWWKTKTTTKTETETETKAKKNKNKDKVKDKDKNQDKNRDKNQTKDFPGGSESCSGRVPAHCLSRVASNCPRKQLHEGLWP